MEEGRSQRLKLSGLALPHYQDIPALVGGPRTRERVTFDIASQLRKLVIRVFGRLLRAETTIVLVPKASMHEDDFLQPGKDEIGRARTIPVVQAKPEPRAVCHSADHHFRLRVPRTDP